MISLFWFLVFAVIILGFLFQRASLSIFTVSTGILLLVFSIFSPASVALKIILWLVWIVIFGFNLRGFRRHLFTKKIFSLYKKVMPKMSRTEREALEAGTVWWDGELFSGKPEWDKLLAAKKPELTEEEKSFIDGPVNELCSMIDDWDITHNRAALPPEVWQFIRDHNFFGLVIPKKYGGKEFSAYAHSLILVKLFSRSVTAASTIAVPNSLGPAELILHYGTDEQKNYYLPRLSKGEEVPCFALTAPDAGSDAGAMPDYGIVCKGEFNGKEVLGIRLNWNKRYITLAPVATVLGLAFKLYDPDHLLGEKKEPPKASQVATRRTRSRAAECTVQSLSSETSAQQSRGLKGEGCIGITCALIPVNTPGITIGRRHLPLNAVFQNGPVQGKDVFIPIDYLIGGQAMAGQGWRMLIECLSVGRSITLPSSGVAAGQFTSLVCGAYSRIRRQFKMPIGRFEGIEEMLGRIVGRAYQITSMSQVTLAAIDGGEKPAVLSGIVKYHCTELGRQVVVDCMDVHGGKGICLGPNNYLGSAYQSTPIGITLEGANILTRNLIIYGQGAVRSHPYVLKEMQAARMKDSREALSTFDKLIFAHVGFGLSNLTRSFLLGVSHGHLSLRVPHNKLKRYYQHITRFSAAFALMSDMAMISLGGELKRRERISARLSDILSYLYMGSVVLKHYANQGSPKDDLPLVEWACQDALYRAEQAFHELLLNFPNKMLACMLRVVIFPLGRRFKKPSDRLDHQLSQLVMNPTATRDRLVADIYLEDDGHNPAALLTKALEAAISIEPIEKAVHKAVKQGEVTGYNFVEQVEAAVAAGVISKEDYQLWLSAKEICHQVINVDDFDSSELERAG